MDPGGAEVRHFVALEDWLSDGVAMPLRAAKDLLIGWQLRNATAAGEWHLCGAPVVPGEIAMPVLAFCGRGDTIAPPAMAEPLATAIPGARVERPPTGHVGMVVGQAARAAVWTPMATFLHAHAG
jgi:polyhydroxyalkanoate synthase